MKIRTRLRRALTRLTRDASFLALGAPLHLLMVSLLSVVFGLVWGVIAGADDSAPIVLGFVVVTTVFCVPALTVAHCWRFRRLLGIDIPRPGWRRPWRQFGYHALAGTLFGALEAVVVALIPAGLVVSLTSVWVYAIPWEWRIKHPGYSTQAAFLTVTGLLVLAAVPSLTAALVRLESQVVPTLLGRSREEDLARRVEDLTESRAGAVDAADAERRRIERDLHDGAQQRLVSLALNLGIAKATLADLPPEAREVIDEAHREAKEAIEELSSLVRGLHPAVLDELGLDAALSGLAARAPLPVRLRADLPRRPPPGDRGGRLLRRLRGADERRQARPGGDPGRCDGHPAGRDTAGDDRGRRPGRGRPRQGKRPDGARPARAVRRRNVSDDQPGGGTDHDERGSAVSELKGAAPGAGQGEPGVRRAVIAEDSVLLRMGLVKVVEMAGFAVAAEVGDAEGLLAAVEEHRPDLAVVDVRMPPGFTDEGVRAALSIRRSRPSTALLLLSQYVEERYAADLLAANTSGVGYLLKQRVADVEEFIEALRRVADGGTALDPQVVAQLLVRRSNDPLERLTAREREVLSLMAEGRSNAGIAAQLVVSESAVAKHINSILAKLDLPKADADHRQVLAVLRFLGVGA